MYSFEGQSIGLGSIANARELGGYILPDGSRIRKGLLLRGGSLAKASQEDLGILAEKFRVSKVFDFRTAIEVQLAPDQEIRGAKNIWMPAFDEEMQTMEMLSLPQEAYRNLESWLPENSWRKGVQEVARAMYTQMVVNDFTQVQYAGFLMNVINTDEGAVYWHCSQGKDRTGLGAAFLLFALGADRELVMEDYAVSNEYYAEDLKKVMSKVSTDEEKAVIQTFIGVNCEYFSAALDLIDVKYGSMDNYLRSALLLGDDDIATLKRRYLE